MAREEHDYLGTRSIEDSLYYGIVTVRGMEASGVSGHTAVQECPELLYYLAAVKKAAAAANRRAMGLAPDVEDAIRRAAEEVMEGKWQDQFPTDILTGGGGISIHMNINEVLANRANEFLTGHKGYDRVHPNTHVNMGQSTNDVLPSAILLALRRILLNLAGAAQGLVCVLQKKEEEFRHTVKVGRTCLQDALPITLGQEFSGYRSCIERQARLLESLADEALALPLGATAIGTGSGTLPGYAASVYEELERITGWKVHPAENYFDSLQNGDLYVRISGAMKTLAGGISKMASDLRLLSSGPRSGFRELHLPAVTPGSSIMPGKINPVLPELMMQIYFQVCGNDVAVSMAAERADLDLNVWEALILKCLCESGRLLNRSIPLFAGRCVAGITADEKRCRKSAEDSVALSALLSAIFGYETGSAVAREAEETGKTIYETAVQKKLLTEEEANDLLDPELLTDSGRMESAIRQLRLEKTGEKND